MTQSALQTAAALFEAKRYRAASTAFAKLAENGVHRIEANRGLGRALAALDNYDEAASRYEAAIEVDLADEKTYDALQEIWDQLSDPDGLIARIQRRVDSSASRAAHAAWANFLAGRNNTELALAEYEKASANSAAVILRWGEALAQLERHEEALDRYERAIPLFPAGVVTDLNLSSPLTISLSALGTPDDRIVRIQAIVDSANNASVRLQWARTLYDINHAAGPSEYNRALALQPDQLAWISWGDSLSNNGEHDEALRKYEQAIAVAPTAEATYQKVAETIKKLESANTAIDGIRIAVDRTRSSTAHVLWARVLSGLGKEALAAKQFEAAFRLSQDEASYIDWATTLHVLGANGEATYRLAGAIRRTFDASKFQECLTSILTQTPSAEPILNVIQHEIDNIDDIDAGVTYIACGNALASLGDADAALVQYGKAELKSPENSEIYLGKGNVLALQGQHKEALEQFAISVAKRPYNKDTFTRIRASLAQVDAETRTLLIDTVQENVDRCNNSEVYSDWGRTLTMLIEHTAAIQQHERATELNPEEPNLKLAFGGALCANQKFARAIGCYAQVIKLSSGDMATLGDALKEFKSAFAHLDNDQHVAAIDEAIAAIDGAAAYREWGDVLSSIDLPGSEFTQAEKALKKWPTNAELRAWYGSKLVEAGRIDEGLAEHRLAAEQKPDEAYVHNAWGLSLLRLRLFREAAGRFEQVAELQDWDGYFNWAVALDGIGSYEAAVKKYKERIQIAGALAETAYCLHNIANIRERQGDYITSAKAWDDALEAYERVFSQPDCKPDASLFLYRGYVFHESKRDFRSAEDNYGEALKLEPKNVEVLAAIVRLNLIKLEYAGSDGQNTDRTTEYQWAAREAYGKAKRILSRRLEDLTTAPALIELGRLHLAMSEEEEAKTCFTKALALDKDSPDALALLGQTCVVTEEFRSALNHAKAGLARDPQNLSYRTNLAEIHLKLNELDRAETEYGKVLAIAPGHVDALIGLGNTFMAQADEFLKNGRSSDAENMYSRALDQICESASVAGKAKGSRELSPVELALLSYSRGYANVMRYEMQTLSKRDKELLKAASTAFNELPSGDPNYHKAQRAKLKIEERTQPSERTTRLAGWIIVGGATLTFLIANVTFLFAKPEYTKSFQVTDRSVQLLKTAKTPPDITAKLQALAGSEAVPKAEFDEELKSALGDEYSKKFGDTIRKQASTSWTFQWQSLEAGYYVLLAFGSLMFMVAGLYLQQLTKLKFGSIELEKTSETTTKDIGSLGISKLEKTSKTATKLF